MRSAGARHGTDSVTHPGTEGPLATAGTRGPDQSSLTLQRSLSEAWFSNTLAWLLDPRGSHKLGVRFAEAFAATIGRRRSEGGEHRYARRATFLKSGRGGDGVGAAGFSFANAAVIREFYLSRSVQPDGDESQFCDVVFMDLDTSDSFFLTIENKLFMPAWAPQLRAYQEAVDRKYDRVKVREFVVLTLRPTDVIGGDLQREVARQWVHLSWTGDVLGILNSLTTDGRTESRRAVKSLKRLLNWISHTSDSEALSDRVRCAFRDHLVRAAADCLKDELARLHAAGGGQWLVKRDTGQSITLRHSTHARSDLCISMLPGLSVAVEERKGDRRARIDKIIVPFGAHPAQVFNLLDIAARDVYRGHFSTSAVRGDARWRPVNRGPVKARHEPLLRFVYRHQHALKVVLYRTFATPAP